MAVRRMSTLRMSIARLHCGDNVTLQFMFRRPPYSLYRCLVTGSISVHMAP